MRLAMLILQALTVAGAAAAPVAVMAAAGGDPKDIVAAQIRAQGYACDQPQSAEQDAQASKPNEEVWVLQCEGAQYRVRLVPDMGAQVETLKKK
ncbi:MAG: hypothetical protein ACXWKB_06375 [Methyloceanibacter sp.]